MNRSPGVALAGAIVVGLLLATTSPVLARGPIDQHLEPASSSTAARYAPHAFWPGDWISGAALAQTFTVGRTGRLDGIAILIAGESYAETLIVEIRRGEPGGPALAHLEVPAASIPGKGGWVAVDIIPPPSVRADEVLAIVLPELAPTTPGSVARQPTIRWTSTVGGAADEYAEGAGWNGERFHALGSSSDPPVRWMEHASDLMFRTFVTPVPDTATVEEPDARPAGPWEVAALVGVLGQRC